VGRKRLAGKAKKALPVRDAGPGKKVPPARGSLRQSAQRDTEAVDLVRSEITGGADAPEGDEAVGSGHLNVGHHLQSYSAPAPSQEIRRRSEDADATGDPDETADGELDADEPEVGIRRARGSLKRVPQTLYTLSDPRTKEVRYAGRTAETSSGTAPAKRLRQHVRLATSGSPQPLYRWLRRLKARGLKPDLRVEETGVEHTKEMALCDRLVKEGNRLLNTRPGAQSLRGQVVVDVEREGDELVADVAHLGLELREPIPAEPAGAIAGVRFRLRDRVAVAALREIANLIETAPTDPREERQKDRRELARFLARRLFSYVDPEAVAEAEARAAELRALVVELEGAERLDEGQRKRLLLLTLFVNPDKVEGAPALIRRYLNPRYQGLPPTVTGQGL
jgi:hypothetical protein